MLLRGPRHRGGRVRIPGDPRDKLAQGSVSVGVRHGGVGIASLLVFHCVRAKGEGRSWVLVCVCAPS